MAYYCLCGNCGKEFTRLRRRGSFVTCSPCQSNARAKAWKQENKGVAKTHGSYSGTQAAKEKYAKSDRGLQKGREKSARYSANNPEKVKADRQASYYRNHDASIQKVVDRSKRLLKATPPWADAGKISAIYAEARRVSRETGVRHHVDHIIPLKGRRVSGLHTHENLRVITASENWAKHNAFSSLSETA